jgi:thiol-disulfide isomerase/thioredoxin
MAIQNIRLIRVGFCLGALLISCGRTTSVRVEDIPVTPATAADIQQAVREPGAKVVLLNMWATWCGPCREEFPDLVKLAKDYRDRGLRVVFVSWDDDEAMARQFLAEQGVDFPSYIKVSSESDPNFINAIEPRWTGAFPATMIFDARGKVQNFWEGKASYAQLEQRVLEVLNQQTHGG